MKNLLIAGIVSILSSGAMAGTKVVCNQSPFSVTIDVENVTTASGTKESHFVVLKNGLKVADKNFVTYEARYNTEMRAYVWGFKNNDNEQIGVGTREMPNNIPAPGTWASKAQGKIVTPQGTFQAGIFNMAVCSVTITN